MGEALEFHPDRDPVEPREDVRVLKAMLLKAEEAGISEDDIRTYLRMSSEERRKTIANFASPHEVLQGTWLQSIEDKIAEIRAAGVDSKEFLTQDLLSELTGEK